MQSNSQQCQYTPKIINNLSQHNKMYTHWFHCIVVLCLVSTSVSTQSWDGIAIAKKDYQGLQALKNDLYDPYGFLKSWNGTGLDACSGAWLGVKCVRGNVVVVQLPWRGLGGTISDKIGQLTSLRKLSLHDNSIGGEIPSALGLLPDLRGLVLFNNRFSGSIPASIGNCINLQTVDLSRNLLTGSIPSSIANSSKLYRLNVSYNNLLGTIPVEITRSLSLTFLALEYNNLSGSVPDTWGGVLVASKATAQAYNLQTLSLDYNSLGGAIPTALSRLPSLREISLSHNRLSGSVPQEIGSLPMLARLDLSENSLGGSFPSSLCNLSSLAYLNLAGNQIHSRIPETIDGLKNLSFLSLKRNNFEGEIPIAIGNISRLSQLDLSDNNLSGTIPASLVHLSSLTFLNVSNNNLSGPVPQPLSKKFNSSSFVGNIQLCGYSPSVHCPTSPNANLTTPFTPSNSKHKKLSTKKLIIIIAAVVVFAVLLLLLCFLLCCLIRKRGYMSSKSKGAAAAARGVEKTGQAARTEEEGGGDGGGKLVHFDGPLLFTADDLLCATAEVMGKSTFGTVYKATLEDGNEVAVKRLREKITKNEKEFESEVSELGKIRHPNLLPFRAYYLGPKSEKLLVFDYLPKGSLASFLHARGPEVQIEWTTRMNIAKGVTRGLMYLHNTLNMVHGNLTSSNILLDDDNVPKISDYGLSRLVTTTATSNVIATASALGYSAPELSKTKKPNLKTDIYSLGVIMLELLTGKSPGEVTNGMDLPQWVASIVKEEWTSEVFDVELMKDASSESSGDELLNTLKLALHCVDPSPAARPETQEVLKQLDEIKQDVGVGVAFGSGDGGSSLTAGSSLIDD